MWKIFFKYPNNKTSRNEIYNFMDKNYASWD
jgi:hypothetical protein